MDPSSVDYARTHELWRTCRDAALDAAKEIQNTFLLYGRELNFFFVHDIIDFRG